MRAWKERREKGAKDVNVLIDVKASMESGKSRAYINQLQKINIGNFVKFTNFMQEHGLLEAEDLIVYERGQKVQIINLQKELDSRILQRKVQQVKYENVRDYVQYKRIYITYRKSGSQTDFKKQYQKEIEGYVKAEAYLKSIGIQEPSGKVLKEILEKELMPLNEEIKNLRQTIDLQKQELQKTAAIRQIYEQTFGIKLKADDINSLQSAANSVANKSQKKEDIQH